jgi:transposase
VGSSLRKTDLLFSVLRLPVGEEAYGRCCGIDIHKDTIVICVLPAIDCDGQAVRKTYGTFRNDLIRMRVWLKQLKVTEIAMESTGVYFALSSALIKRVQVPPATQMRSAVSKSGDNTSLAGESGRYGEA